MLASKHYRYKSYSRKLKLLVSISRRKMKIRQRFQPVTSNISIHSKILTKKHSKPHKKSKFNKLIILVLFLLTIQREVKALEVQ